MAVPYTFGSATTSIPLSQLDSNFATAITLGNTAVQLGNTITTLTGVSNVASATSLSLGSNGNTTAVTIDTSQNVGIGTTSPADGQGFGRAVNITNGTTGGAVYFTTSTSTNYGWLGKYNSSTQLGDSGSAGIVFTTGNGSGSIAERMRIDSSGNVGIGTTSYTEKLVVNGAIASKGTTSANQTSALVLDGTYSSSVSAIRAWGASGTTATLAFLTGSGGSNDSERMRITSGGDLLVSTTDAANSSGNGVKIAGNGSGPYVAVVNPSSSGSNLGMSLYSSGASAFRFYADCGGTLHATSTSIAAISDASLKTNVKDLETGLTQVMALKPRRFDWINGDATNVAGFIAQEVEQILPELVTDSLYAYDENKNEVYKKNLKMGDMLPTLVKAIQEQQALITAQAETINALTARIVALEAK
jgi:hypothetical protein